ncbi:hypothetical protein HOP50_18g81130 [Chloropicon primus]|nr:hypothetical protein HOP50_18g81130 [Chloropicon primus]
MFVHSNSKEENSTRRVSIPTQGGLEDAHPVHGIQTSEGSMVLCGKASVLEGEAELGSEAFAIKVDGLGGLVWSWSSGLVRKGKGSNVANAVVQVSSKEVLVVGYSTISGSSGAKSGARTMWKLDLQTGGELWKAELGQNDAGSKTSAYEMAEVDGDSLLLSGVTNKDNLDEMFFKSYGNVAEGVAFVESFPLSSIAGLVTPKPTDSARSWITTFAGYSTAKAARAAGDSVAVLLYGEDNEKHAGLAVVNKKDGAHGSSWPKNYGNSHGEATDLVVSHDKKAVVITGHKSVEPGTYSGALSKITLDQGILSWSKFYGAGGNPYLIYNECWSVARVGTDGYILGCGTGIEGCEDTAAKEKGFYDDCVKGKGDTRDGAINRPPGVWQSYLNVVSEDGNLLYSRVDQYRQADPLDEFPLGAPSWSENRMQSSAAEWVFETTDGGITVITDEQFGIGLLKLKGSTTTTPGGPASPSPAPTPTPTPTPAPAPGSPGLVTGRAMYNQDPQVEEKGDDTLTLVLIIVGAVLGCAILGYGAFVLVNRRKAKAGEWTVVAGEL